MKRTCATCGKNAYPSQDRAISVALRCSRQRGTALRVYHCPQHEAWHLTSRATWHDPTPPPPPVAEPGYRRPMAALLAERRTVSEQELITAAAGGANPRQISTIVTDTLNTWCRWGLVYPDGQTIIAVDVPALRNIAARGWTAWTREQSTDDAEAAPSPNSR
ncbi:hypothetical protein [Catellatospora sp. NPDC049133]|uniref:hypothetical protein n=1 Tax=Catellatospora sp. NPDC049133 TaxID=3155499 RepID=UPI0033C09371